MAELLEVKNMIEDIRNDFGQFKIDVNNTINLKELQNESVIKEVDLRLIEEKKRIDEEIGKLRDYNLKSSLVFHALVQVLKQEIEKAENMNKEFVKKETIKELEEWRKAFEIKINWCENEGKQLRNGIERVNEIIIESQKDNDIKFDSIKNVELNEIKTRFERDINHFKHEGLYLKEELDNLKNETKSSNELFRNEFVKMNESYNQLQLKLERTESNIIEQTKNDIENGCGVVINKLNERINKMGEKREIDSIATKFELFEREIKLKYKRNFSLVSFAIGNVESQVSSVKSSFEKFVMKSMSKEKEIDKMQQIIPKLWKGVCQQRLERFQLENYYDDLSRWTGLDGIGFIELIPMERSRFSSSFIAKVKGSGNIMFLFKTIDQLIFGCYNGLVIPSKFTKPGDVETGIGIDENHFIFMLDQQHLNCWRMKKESETLELFKEESDNLLRVENAFCIKKSGEVYFTNKIGEYYSNSNETPMNPNTRNRIESFHIIHWE